MRTIDILVFKYISFENKTLTKDIVKYNSNSVIMYHDGKRMWTEYQPDWCDIKIKHYIFSTGNSSLDYLLKPIIFTYLFLNLYIFFLKIILKYKVKIVLIENVFLSIFVGILRKLNFINKSIYLCSDWVAGSKTRFGIWTNLDNNYIFPFCDYIASRLNDITLNTTQEMIDARTKYWSKKITNSELVYKSRMQILGNLNTKNVGKKIIFLGMTRSDSGLDIALIAINKLNKNYGFKIMIIGPSNDYHQNLKQLAEKQGVKDLIDFKGFVDRKLFSKYMSECFCGINLITVKDNFSAKTIPAKIIDYLEHLLPVIVTENVGPLAKIIKKNKLGLVINPLINDYIKAVETIYKNNEFYKNNIVRFIKSSEGTDLRTIFGG